MLHGSWRAKRPLTSSSCAVVGQGSHHKLISAALQLHCNRPLLLGDDSLLSRISVEPFLERHGLRACMVAPTKIIAGLGMSLGIECLSVPGTTGMQNFLSCSWFT